MKRRRKEKQNPAVTFEDTNHHEWFKRIRQTASTGDVPQTIREINKVRSALEGWNRTLNSNFVKEVEEICYAAGVAPELERAREIAAQGRIDEMHLILRRAKSDGRMLRFPVRDDIRKIKLDGYIAAAHVALKSARDDVGKDESGSLSSLVREYVGHAQSYANQLGLDISAKVTRVYNAAVRTEIELAKATIGTEDSDHLLSGHINSAHTYAREIDLDISEEINDIYLEAILSEFDNATRCAGDDSRESLLERHLTLAQKYANIIGINILQEIAKFYGGEKLNEKS